MLGRNTRLSLSSLLVFVSEVGKTWLLGLESKPFQTYQPSESLSRRHSSAVSPWERPHTVCKVWDWLYSNKTLFIKESSGRMWPAGCCLLTSWFPRFLGKNPVTPRVNWFTTSHSFFPEWLFTHPDSGLLMPREHKLQFLSLVLFGGDWTADPGQCHPLQDFTRPRRGTENCCSVPDRPWPGFRSQDLLQSFLQENCLSSSEQMCPVPNAELLSKLGWAYYAFHLAMEKCLEVLL